MTPAMAAALATGRATLTAFYQLDLPSGTRRLLLGSTEVAWAGHKFVGRDPDFGHIDAPDDISEDMTGEAPNTGLTIALASGADPDDAAGPDVQLSRFRAWLAALSVDDVTKRTILIPDPDLLFDGFIDQATMEIDKRRNDVDYTVISGFDYFFEDSEGERLNGQFHKSIWTGETGLDNVSGITKKIYWGTNAPPGTLGSGSSIYGGGGGFNPYGWHLPQDNPYQ